MIYDNIQERTINYNDFNILTIGNLFCNNVDKSDSKQTIQFNKQTIRN